MVVNLVPQNAHQPGAFGGLAAEIALRFDRCQERLLDEVLGHISIAHLADGKVEKVIRMRLNPVARKRGFGFAASPRFCNRVHSDCPFRNARATKRVSLQCA